MYLGVSTRGQHDYTAGRAPEEVPCGEKTNMWQYVSDDAPDDNCGRRVVVPVSALGGCTPGRATRANTMFIELGNAAGRDQEICVDDVSINT